MDIKIAAIVIALKRMEWPFLEEWCSILKGKGVSKLYIRCHFNENLIWNKKPNEKFYHLNKNDEEINYLWQEAISKSKNYLDIEEMKIEEKYSIRLQMKTLQEFSNQAARDKFDWVLSCDLDEIPVTSFSTLTNLINNLNYDISAISANQILFDSRWDKDNNYEPRGILATKHYNSKVVTDRCKFLYKPSKVILEPLSPHQIKINEGKMFYPDDKIFLFHHFRGVEYTKSKMMSKILDFPFKTENSISMIKRKIFI